MPGRVPLSADDCADRSEAAVRQRLALRALELLNSAGDVSALSSELLRLIRDSIGFDAVGLRLRQGDDFPYYEQSGFSDDFVRQENFLCVKDAHGHVMRDAARRPVLECTCGVVLSGRADPSMPCFTRGGSFWTNASAEPLALTAEGDPRTNPRSRCVDAGYRSFALIPLRSGDEIIGLLQLNDRCGGRFTPDLVQFFEGLGASIGIALRRKQVEGALRESEERYRQIVELSPEAIAVHSEGRIVFANRAAVRLAGAKNADELLGRSVFDLVHPDDRAQAVQRVQLSINTGTPAPLIEQKFIRLDGTVIDAEIRSQMVTHEGRPAIQVLIRDITERKRVETEQTALLGIAKDIAGVVDLNEMLARVHQRVAAVLPCDRVGTYYWDAARKTYRAMVWHGVPPALAADAVALEFDSGQPVTERLLAGETVLINDIAEQGLVPLEILTHFGLTAVLVVPLVVRGRRMGALAALNAESGRRFDPRQVRLFEGIAQYVGVAIAAADLYRAQEEETAVAGALARVGQELISALSSPALLDRLCQVTTEVLGCDYSRTWLWHTPDEAFVPVAGYGDSPEQWAIIRLVKLDRSALTAQLDGMERDGLFNVKIADLPESEARTWASAYGVAVGLMVPLRRGGELVGFHTADYRSGEEVVGGRRERIARGIGQLASLALESVRLIEELERANRLKADFVATMSHELRTPLNVIMGYTDLLLDGAFGPMSDEQLDKLRRVDSSAQGLLELITATLDLSRLETGLVRLDVQPIDLPGLVGELDAEIPGLREKADVDFAWDLAPELPPLCSDAAKLKVVLKNLIGNALKYTSTGAVVVRLRPRNGGMEITVADTGAGIAPETLPVIFEPFRQGEPTLTRKYGGVGLGLYIVRRLLDVLGGTIEVESTLGRGSTFRVWVPSRAAA
jgi:PAS domain S-box-containing protein